MNATEIDHILSDEETIEPSPAFASRVMRAVRADSVARPSFTRRPAAAWLERLALATFAVVSVTAADAVGNAAAPEIGRTFATWLSLLLPCTLAIGWWLARPFRHRSAAQLRLRES
jgi:hypothetical protein